MSDITLRLPLKLIDVRPQARQHFGHESLVRLAETIRQHGQQSPILVEPHDGRYSIVAGERRYRAMTLLGAESIEAKVVCLKTKADADAASLVENCAREDLLPMEKARGIAALIASRGYTAAEAATHLGISESSISKLLAVLDLPQDVQVSIDRGELALSSAYEITRIPDTVLRDQTARTAARNHLSREQVVRMISRGTSGDMSRTQRFSANLHRGIRVTVESADALTLDAYVAVLEDLLVRARRARSQSLVLDTFLRTVNDRAKEAAR